MKIESPAFAQNEEIPSKYTCDGDNVSPPIEWSDVPSGTRTVALICDDPDAPRQDFAHWVMFNIPPEARVLPEDIEGKRQLPDGSRQGTNDFGKLGYGGPCPPSGTHHYRFTLYALDNELSVPPSSTKHDVETAMNGHVLEAAQLTGAYKREQ